MMTPEGAARMAREKPKKFEVLVAEKLLGWRRGGKDDYVRPYHTTETRKRPGQEAAVVSVDDYEGKGGHDYLVPPGERSDNRWQRHYLCSCAEENEDHIELPGVLHPTDMMPALTVAAKMREKGWKWSFTERHDGWHAELGRAGVEDEECWVEHIVVNEDLRLASLLVALQAEGVVSR